MTEFTDDPFYPIKLSGLPPTWAASYIGSVVPDVQSGFPCGAHNRETEGIPHLRPMNISRDGNLDLADVKYVSPGVNALRVSAGDVLFNNTNSPELIGKTAVIPISDAQEMAFSNHMTRLRPPDGVRASFLAYQLHYLWMSGYFRHRCTNHVNQASISGSSLAASVPFIIAPSKEQHRIVDEIEKQFTRLDTAGSALERAQANLRRYRASVLKAACEGRLVPSEAGLARKQGRDYEPADKLLQRILRERRARWEADTLAKMIASRKPPKDDAWKRKYKEPVAPETAGLPPLPEGWCWTNLSQLKLFSLYGPRFSSNDYAQDGVAVLRTTDISSSGKVNMVAAPRLQLKESDVQKFQLMPGDLVFTRTGATVGKLAIFNDDVEAIPGAYLIHYRLAITGSVPWYVYRFFQTKTGQDALVRGTRGIGQPNLNAPTIEAIPIPMPPQSEQGRVLEAVEKLLGSGGRQEEVVEAGKRKANRIKAAVLRSAFSGILIPQDPRDEPASVLLDRFRAERGSAEVGKPGRRTKEPAYV